MIKKISKITSWLGTAAVIYLFVPASLVLAAGPSTQSVQLVNPIKINSIEELLTTLLEIMIILAMPIIVFFIILAGFKYVTAKGNPQQIEEATRALTYAIIGGVLVIGAVAIAQIVKNLVTSF